MLLALAALAVGGYIAWDLFGPSDRDPNKPLPSIPEPSLYVALPVPAAPVGRVIFWVGDSLTTAKPWKLVKLPGAKLDGQGWSGETISSVVKHAFPLVVKAHATDVVLRAGVNDVIADHTAERIKADLAAGWQKLQDAGVRVWAGLLTPWAGHKKSTAARQAVTRAVNDWIRAQVGKPGGPVAVIAADTLGDDAGRLRPEFSGDGLHMKQVGYVALAALDARALVNGGNEMRTMAEVGIDLPNWPAGWRKPTREILTAVSNASELYGVPEDIIHAVIRKESSHDPKLRGYKPLKASYARNKDIAIPGGGGLTWGQKFDEDGWRAYGIMQVLPFNLWGVKGLLKASAPISAAFDVRTNILGGARVLKILFDKFGTWEDAVWKYNGSHAYQREVFAFLNTYRAAQVA